MAASLAGKVKSCVIVVLWVSQVYKVHQVFIRLFSIDNRLNQVGILGLEEQHVFLEDFLQELPFVVGFVNCCHQVVHLLNVLIFKQKVFQGRCFIDLVENKVGSILNETRGQR